MKRRPVNTRRLLTVSVVASLLASCSPTTIVGDVDTTVPADTTTTTMAPPTGDIRSLVDQLIDTATGLGDAVVNGDTNETNARLARAEQILRALEPKVKASGLDILEELQRIVGLVRTSVQRKRPAEADKAQRFAMLIADSLGD